jgi:hypothetical protein
MMTRMRLVLGALVGMVIALGAGFVWGSSGQSALNRAVQEAELRSDLFEARSAVLAARVDLYNVNFGNASRNLESAKAVLSRATERLKNTGRDEDVTKLDPALAQISEAQSLAGRFDQSANARAGSATQTIDEVLGLAR